MMVAIAYTFWVSTFLFQPFLDLEKTTVTAALPPAPGGEGRLGDYRTGVLYW